MSRTAAVAITSALSSMGRSCSKGRDERVQLRESAGPATLVVGAGLGIDEAVVQQFEHGAAGVRREFDRHARYAFRRAVPGPAEDQLALGNHFLVGAANLM